MVNVLEFVTGTTEDGYLIVDVEALNKAIQNDVDGTITYPRNQMIISEPIQLKKDDKTV